MAGDRQLRCEAAFGLADDILRAIRAATSWPALRTVARDVTDAMGFRYFALITHEDLREPRSGAVDLRDYAEGAVRRIIPEFGYLRDPIMRCPIFADCAFLFSEFRPPLELIHRTPIPPP